VADRRIETERLVLLPVDGPLAARIVRGDLTGMVPGRGWPTTDTVDGMRYAAAAPDDAPSTGWLIALRDGTVIGDCGWKGPPGDDGVIEIGYGLAPPYQRQGYGAEAVRALVEWSLAQPGIGRIVADSLLDNVASRRILERAGFELTHTDSQLAFYARSAGG
jgi:RimJ/RimL family protein N-acetyltransferase